MLGGGNGRRRLWCGLAVAASAGAVWGQSGGGPGLATDQPIGLLVRANDDESWRVAPEVATELDIQVRGMVARAQVRQRFTNPSAERVEAIYVFPLPENAAVDRFELTAGHRRVVGQVQERRTAQRTYQQARDEGRTASLLAQARPNLFRVAVSQLEPGAEIIVDLGYVELARYDRGDFHLRVPLVAAPRFTPPAPTTANATTTTARAAIAPAADPALPAAARPVRLAATVDAGVELADLWSSSHALTRRRVSSHVWHAELAAGRVPADRDLELAWRPKRSSLPRVARFEEEVAGERYVALFVLPPAPEASGTPIARDLVIVLDRSGSMGGTSIVQAKRAVDAALAKLAPHDRFNLVRFSDRAEALFDDVVPADSRAVAIAREWLAGVAAGGGTNLLAAIELALTGTVDAGAVRQVLFVTDGCVGNESELFATIERRLGASRLFTVGIGSAPNSYFMSRAAALGRGTHTYIGRVDQVEAQIEALFAKLERPVVADLEVEWGDPRAEMLPARTPDLYLGEPLVVLARLVDPEAPVAVRGRSAEAPFEVALPAAAPTPAVGLAKLWARRKIDALEAAMREPGAERDQLRAELVGVALEHGLVSRHTSFVAVDDQPSAPGPPQAKRTVPTLVPAGWATPGDLPQGGTPARLLLLAAMLAALLGGALLHGGAAWRAR
jgi:Ca-activated chloride channel family protein